MVKYAKLFSVAALVLIGAVTRPSAQEDPPRSATRGRSGAATREFLGLGPAPDPIAAERGEKLYAPNCAFCHGAKATGAGGPDLVRSPLVLHDEKGESIGPVLLQGRTDKGMPAFANLTPDQISDIAQFLHMRVELAANRGLYKVENVVTGNARAGEAYFKGPGGCTNCHSVTGDLAHIGSRLDPAELQSAFLWPPSVKGRIAEKVTVILASGESVSGTLQRLDDFDLSMYDSAGNYRSWPREDLKRVSINDHLSAHRELLDRYADTDIHNLLAYLVTLK